MPSAGNFPFARNIPGSTHNPRHANVSSLLQSNKVQTANNPETAKRAISVQTTAADKGSLSSSDPAPVRFGPSQAEGCARGSAQCRPVRASGRTAAYQVIRSSRMADAETAGGKQV